MELHLAQDLMDQEVEYRAFTGASPQRVVVTDVLDGAVLVRFPYCTYSRRVHPRDLSVLDELAQVV